jgi:hypothetical protein
MKKATTLFAIAVLCLSASTLRADAIGTLVTGTLNFNGFGTTNYFDAANGFVPPGYGNSGGSITVPIDSGIVEFGYNDTANLDTADFTGSSLTITDESFVGNSGGYTMTFTDPAFTGFTAVDNELGLLYSFSGHTLTVTFPAGNIKGTESSAFEFTSITPIPEPGTLALMATGLLGAAVLIHRRRLS